MWILLLLSFFFSAMPFELYTQWRQYPWVFGELVCDAKVLTQETITYSSIFTILAFTVERYLAICHPLSIPRKSKMSRAIRVIAVVWISSVSFSIPWIFYNKVSQSLIHAKSSLIQILMDAVLAKHGVSPAHWAHMELPISPHPVTYPSLRKQQENLHTHVADRMPATQDGGHFCCYFCGDDWVGKTGFQIVWQHASVRFIYCVCRCLGLGFYPPSRRRLAFTGCIGNLGLRKNIQKARDGKTFKNSRFSRRLWR